MADTPDYKLDIQGLSSKPSAGPPKPRPYLRVQFACCNVYQRIYRSADEKSYQGRCPKCGKPVRFIVGEGGTDARDFIVY
jgi:hypothetical protein